MKILQVCSAENLGGGERHVTDLTRALIERGHELHLGVRSGSPLRKVLADLPINWHELKLRNALDWGSARRLATIIREQNIEVLHAHVARDYTVCGFASKLAPVKFFLTRHHFNPIRSNPLYKWALSNAKRLIAVSESVRVTLSKAFPSLASRVVVVPNWIDPKDCGKLSRAEAREKLSITQSLAVATIGQLTPLKQQYSFILAATIAIIKYSWRNVEFLLVGAATPEDAAFENKLHELVAQFKTGDHVRFTGYVTDLPAQLAAFDIVVATSENEAFSLALAEAMAAGCAVVAFQIGGMADLIEDGVTGLLTPPNDVKKLAAAIIRLLEDESLRAKLGAAARAHVRERYDRERVITQIEQLYLEA